MCATIPNGWRGCSCAGTARPTASSSKTRHDSGDADARRCGGEQGRWGAWLGRSLAPCTLLLDGELGAGKTTLVQGLGASLGITDPIVSPTFALLGEYLEGQQPLYHFDLYRLSPAEVPSLAPEIYWEGQEVAPGWVAIEWAQRLPYRPSEYLALQLRHQADGTRWLQVQAQGLAERLGRSSPD
ncbi:MAG: tRNA (adenosine(37)-N6)-threonylcarbamoyltransferase complex ATPase subunit type 1 TsaE [Spirulinaceae cyanobacterium RM2_2_10]|nr:tRNA (adenosine(37)-N6)-threonylcarbamoyltransferase complex ATPase subunit type 1 TsaE [Spirulinaceae cyanobacterium RM2_2_10]